MFDWNDLKAFLAVAREGSTLGAAKAMGVNQTTVARRLEALEAAMGLKLFERGQMGSRLTEAGEDLIAEAERMEEAATRLAHRVADRQRRVEGTLRVTASEILANVAITPVLGAFRAAFPDLVVELVITDQALDLKAGEADIAVRSETILTDGDLVGRKVAEFPFGLYASHDYLLRHGLPASIEDLRHHDLIGGETVSVPLPGVAWMLAQVPGVEPMARCNSMTHLLHMLKAGIGIGPFGSLTADLEPDLVRILDPLPMAPPAWLVTRRDLKDVPRVRAFMDFFVPHFFQLQKSLRSRCDAMQAEKLAALKAALVDAARA